MFCHLQGVKLSAIDFDTEGDEKDIVRLYDGDDDKTSRILANLTGKLGPPKDYYTTQKFMLIKFESDEKNSKSGFKLAYQSIEFIIGEKQGVFDLHSCCRILNSYETSRVSSYAIWTQCS